SPNLTSAKSSWASMSGKSTGIGGVSPSSSFGSSSGSLPGPQTVIPLVISAGASSSTVASIRRVMVPLTANLAVVVTVALFALPTTVALSLVTVYPSIVTPSPGLSSKAIALPISMTDGPLLVMVTVKVVGSPALTRASSATLSIVRLYSRSTGIGGVSASSSSGSFSGSLSGPQTVIPLVIVSPASASTSADTTTVIVPPTALAFVVVTVAVFLVSTTVALLPVTS